MRSHVSKLHTPEILLDVLEDLSLHTIQFCTLVAHMNYLSSPLNSAHISNFMFLACLLSKSESRVCCQQTGNAVACFKQSHCEMLEATAAL